MPPKKMAETLRGLTTYEQASAILDLLQDYRPDAEPHKREHDILIVQAALRQALAEGARVSMASLATEQLGHAIVAIAKRGCEERQPCGAERRAPGSKNKPLRCDGCPFDDVDQVVDHMNA